MDQSHAKDQFDAMGSTALNALRDQLAALAAKNGANVAPPGDVSELGQNDYLAALPQICATGGLVPASSAQSPLETLSPEIY